MSKNYTLILLLFFIANFIQAQDKHFTQFYTAPLALNPALTGTFDGKYRVGGIYRDQWRGVLDNPYVTFAGSVDVRFDVTLDSRYKDAFAVGLLFYNDEVPGIDFSTNQIALSGAFHKGLDYDKTQFLSVGVQGGAAQRNINYEDLTFEDEFNSIDEYSFPTFENLPENNFAYWDLNVGINYTYSPKRNLNIFVGGAIHHILKPQVTFYSAEDNGDSRLYSKYSAQISAQLPLTEKLSLTPRFLIASQGPHLEINTGTNFRIAFNDYSNSALHVGGWVRPVSTVDTSYELDAIVAMVGFELGNVLLGLSYDINLNDLTTTRQGQGAFEISLAYLGNFENEAVLCPKF